MKPLIVIEGDRSLFEDALRRVRADGAEVAEGFRSGGTVRAGQVASGSDAQAAVLAAVRGSGVVVWATAPRDVIDAMCDDLARIGPLDHRTGAGTDEPVLTDEQIALLRLLAEGLTLGEAASRLHLSRRTADRRLGAARSALGAQTTSEALVAARRVGLV